MRNVATREAVLVCTKTPLVDVAIARVKKCPDVPASVLFNVGMFGEVEIFGHKSAWEKTCALVGDREPYVPSWFNMGSNVVSLYFIARKF